jgi:hypothetical protein
MFEVTAGNKLGALQHAQVRQLVQGIHPGAPVCTPCWVVHVSDVKPTGKQYPSHMTPS